jgi:hypothetical protein
MGKLYSCLVILKGVVRDQVSGVRYQVSVTLSDVKCFMPYVMEKTEDRWWKIGCDSFLIPDP